MRQLRPFNTIAQASYWGGGFIAEVEGGYFSLSARSTPAGMEFSHRGLDKDGRPAGAEGWPQEVKGMFVWATPDDGGPQCICTVPVSIPS